VYLSKLQMGGTCICGDANRKNQGLNETATLMADSLRKLRIFANHIMINTPFGLV
jgi:hypothetical protein